MLAMMPARESSVNPISMSSLQKKLSQQRAPGAVEMLLRVRAANCVSFSWCRMCCRMLISIDSSWLFLAKSTRASALTSLTKDRISRVSSLISVDISQDSSTLRRTSTRLRTLMIMFSSRSSISPRSSSSELSTSSERSSSTASRTQLRISLQSQPTFTSPVMTSTMFLEHQLSSRVLNILTNSWKIGVDRIYFRLTGFMVRFLKMATMVLRCSRCSSLSGGQRLWAQEDTALKIFSLFSKRNAKLALTLQRSSMFSEQMALFLSKNDSNPSIIRLFSALLWFSLFLLRQKLSFSLMSSSMFLAISVSRERFSSRILAGSLGALAGSTLAILRGLQYTRSSSSSSSCPKQYLRSQLCRYLRQYLLTRWASLALSSSAILPHSLRLLTDWQPPLLHTSLYS